MLIYVYNLVVIFFFAFIFFPLKYKKELILSIVFIQLLLFSGLRFEVGRDYLNYTYTFILANRSSTLSNLFYLSRESTVEFMYLLLNRVVGLFTNEVQWIFIVTSFITIYFIFRTIYQHSSIVWLSIFLFTVSGYIASFNLVRQYIAISIVIFSFKYMKEKNFPKYLALIIVASLFHYTALLLIPIYFLLYLNINIKKVTLFTLISLIVSVFLDKIVSLIQIVFYAEYTSSSFGMSSGNIKNIIIALIYFSMAMVFKNSLLKRESSNLILINWSYINFVLAILSLKLWIITRIMDYSSIFLILLIPEIVMSIKDKRLRIILTFAIIILNLLLFYSKIRHPEEMLVPYQYSNDL